MIPNFSYLFGRGSPFHVNVEREIRTEKNDVVFYHTLVTFVSIIICQSCTAAIGVLSKKDSFSFTIQYYGTPAVVDSMQLSRLSREMNIKYFP